MSTSTHESQFHVHHDSDAAVGRRERLGVRLLIVADGAFLASMIFSYFYLRNLNNNNAWLPKGVHHFSVASAWIVAVPFIVVAVIHRFGTNDKHVRVITSAASVFVTIVGLIYQWRQMTHMPFVLHNDNGEAFFNGAYATNWVLIAGAGIFHYLLTLFIALGIMIRTHTTNVSHELEVWRQKTAQSWFTWCAIAGILTAITLTII